MSDRRAGGSRLARMAAAATAVAAPAVVLGPGTARAASPTTPIQHVVVIFQENVSFDHYFGTYPLATNTSGWAFTPSPGTPAVDGLLPATGASLPPAMRHGGNLTTSNPNGVLPHRYDPSSPADLVTWDQDHDYSAEQKAFDSGKLDRFPSSVGNSSSKVPTNPAQKCNANDVMNYYDGNSTTALWEYAQHYAMSDNSFGTTFGPSAPGAINLVAGTTGGVDPGHVSDNNNNANSPLTNGDTVGDGEGGYSLISDAQPYYDDCTTRDAAALSGQNVGDLLNAAGLSWGWFQGGFRPTTTFSSAAPGQPSSTFTPDQFAGATYYKSVTGASNQGLCNADHPIGPALGATGQWGYKDDYIPHHEPFQYYASTANPHHLMVATDASGHDTMAGLAGIGTDTQSYSGGAPQFDTPNHQYDTSDFDQLVAAIDAGSLPPTALPAVSFLKASGYQDGHAGYSDPVDEQAFLVNEVNSIMRSPDWPSTAIVISYDDSDGWYDHVYGGVANPSQTAADFLTGTGECGTGAPLAGQQGRCGPGPRLPLLVISPYARQNFVDHAASNQTSITRFIEDNWSLGRIAGSADATAGSLDTLFDFSGGRPAPAAVLDPTTGSVPGGYRMAAADGGVFSLSGAPYYGSLGGRHLNAPVVAMASTPTNHGYWLFASDGGVFSFGDAAFKGSTGGLHLAQPVVAAASTPDGNRYWLFACDGGVFSFGDAAFKGSTGGLHLAQPVVGGAPTPDGKGYWLFAADGGVFSFGDAAFEGSLGSTRLARPIVGGAATGDGKGYWLFAADGGVFSFGDAGFAGSAAGATTAPVVGGLGTGDGQGYLLVASDGSVYPFGDAIGGGSLSRLSLARPVVAVGAG